MVEVMALILQPRSVATIISFLIALYIPCSPHAVLDIDELSVQYGIEISSQPVILNQQSPAKGNVLHLSSKHGQLYSCYLPSLPSQMEENETSKNENVESVIDILDKSFNDTCITHRKGWWTYKVCYKKEITQYHVPEIGATSGPITSLGLFSSEDEWSEEKASEQKPSELFHSHHYLNGSTCDVTQKRRKTKVQYYCAAKAKDDIIRIEEPATCEYILSVHSTKLCEHPLFSKKEKKKQINLVCSPALGEHEFSKYTERMNRKKSEAQERILKAKMKLDKEAETKDDKDAPEDELLKNDITLEDKKQKFKETMSTFMKGFMKVLNLKAEDVKISSKGGVKIDKEDLFNDDDDVEQKKQQSKSETDETNNDKGETNNDKGELSENNAETDKAKDEDVKHMEADEEKEKVVGKEILKKEGLETNVPGTKEKDEASFIDDLPISPISLIKKLEKDNEHLQNKAATKRKEMHAQFDRIRQESLNELERAKSLLQVLKSVKESTKVKSSQDRVDKQLKFVNELVDSLEDQIKLIDEKRKTVDELEEGTQKLLSDINKKIVNTKKVQSIAQKLDAMKGEKSEVKDHITDKGEIKGSQKLNDNVIKENQEDVKSQEKGDYEDVPLAKEMNNNAGDKPSQLIGSMLTALKSQVKKLNQELKKVKKKKQELSPDTTDADGMSTADELDPDNDEIKEEGEVKGEEVGTGIDEVVKMLRKEMSTINKKLKREKDKVSVEARSLDEAERKDMTDSENAAKENMEVRVRTIDEKAFETDFENDKDIRDEVKEATKKMEETVKKQLKDAGLNFKDNIKIKIITTKDKFDKFSNGKDVKLLSDDEAADFKDLLIGLLGGGKEKASEELRQKMLEENYNFVYEEEEDDVGEEKPN